MNARNPSSYARAPGVAASETIGDFITATEAAEIVGLNRYTFYRWLRRGYIPHQRYGRTVRLSRSELLTFIERHRNSVAPTSWNASSP